MQRNADQGWDNATVLDVVDFGSLHSMRRTPNRALYNSTKAASAALCDVLARGSEVRSAIHVVPAQVDTPMLHSSHWVLKEGGPQSFLDLVRLEAPALYQPVFRECNREAFNDVVRLLGLDSSQLVETFQRYSDRRKVVKESEHGITSPESLAAYLVSEVLRGEGSRSGTLQVTSPQGQLKTGFVAF